VLEERLRLLEEVATSSKPKDDLKFKVSSLLVKVSKSI
jgi:hypothetical protein